MKRNLGIFVIILLTVLLVISCSKMDPVVGPTNNNEQEESVEPVKVTVTTTVLGVNAADNTYLSGVSVYTQEGVPATWRPWPAEDRNTTPIEPNDIEPGHYLFVGVKAGYDTAYSPLEVTAVDTMLTVYLVMHKSNSNPVHHNCSGTATYDPATRKIVGSGDFFKKYTVMMVNGSAYDMLEIEVCDGFEYTVPETYTKVDFVKGDWHDPSTWYYPGRDGCELTFNGAEWVSQGSESWYWLWELQDACLSVTSAPSGASILLDNVMPWPNWPAGHTVTPSGVNVIEPGEHSITASLAGYVSQTQTFTATRGNTTHLHFDMVPIPLTIVDFSIKYFDGGDSSSNGDTLKVTGTELFKLYKVLVVNGSDGRILHIDMKTGYCYNTRQQFKVVRNGDRLALPMDQFGHKYNRVTFKKSTDKDSLSDWYYDGRDGLPQPIINNLVVQLPIDKNQWYTALRI